MYSDWTDFCEEYKKALEENLRYWAEFHERARKLLKTRIQAVDEKASIETLAENS